MKFNKANKYKMSQKMKIKEWSHLRHLLLLQLAGPGPRQLAGPADGDGIGSLHLPGSGECTGKPEAYDMYAKLRNGSRSSFCSRFSQEQGNLL